MTSGEGRDSVFAVEPQPNGDRIQTNTAPDGAISATLFGIDGSETRLNADGSSTYAIEGPDPRLGMLSPVLIEASITSPAGLTATVTTSREAVLSDPANPLSHTELSETVIVNGRTSSQVYDVASRTYTNTSPVGRISNSILNADGRQSQSVIDGLNVVNYAYDGRGRLSNITTGSGGDLRSTTMSYNLQGYLGNLLDAENRNIASQYDLAGRMPQQTLPDSRVIQYTYDSNGNLASLTPPGQPAHVFNYTAVNLESDYTPPSVPGASNPGTLYQYNLDKQLTQITRPDGQSLSFNYGPTSGQLLGSTIPRGNFSYGYDPVSGQLSTITSPDTGGLAFTYDGFLPTSVTWTGDVAGSTSNVYDNDFRISQGSVNGGFNISFQYDDDSLLTGAGALSLTRDTQNGLITGSSLSNTNTTNTYNGFGETTQYAAAQGASTVFDVVYTRDLIGRITQKVEEIGGISTTSNHQYDPAGRLTQVTEGAITTTYSYDSNRRIGKKVNGTFVQGFLYRDQLNPIAELDGSNTVIARFVYGDKANVPAYMEKGGNTYRIINDHLGSPRLVIDTGTGSIVQRIDYDVFGNVTSDSNPGFQPFGFAGGIYDQDTGLTRFGARDYDAQVGRWTSKDPIGFLGGSTGLYTYVGNDPVNLIDPSGLVCESSGGGFLDNIQTGLDVAGLTPGLGIFPDALNAGISLLRGDLSGAGLNVLAMVPILGQGATGAKLGKRVLQSGGQTITKNTANGLNTFAGTNLARRDVGRALEALKQSQGLPNRLTGSKILGNGNLLDDTGQLLGNVAITIRTHLEDDGLPRSRARTTRDEDDLHRAMFRASQKPTVNKINALYQSWNIYRGNGEVTFDPPQTKIWEDTRVAANSPWGSLWLPAEIPEDGMIEVSATFDEPGTYILWVRADDGGLYADGYITVNVE
ncbi:MAG: hypothetical protein COA78_04150 [Blastopirellula sp.]|nr:MAG: hypothetical protein COA78_04150 [Blastopirellula sp.]